ncbi:MAG: hypothetical protein IJV00_02325, partial [Clostridia bacterium]|nr:hypothetical protein [Clostridia bacterium]
MRSKIFTKAIAVLLAAFMSAGFVPAVLAGGSSPSAAQYTVTASYGTVALPDGTPVTGPVAAGTVVVVTYDSASYPSNEFLYWKSSDGTKIPADTFRLLVDCDAWFFPVFSDLTGSFGDWILLHEGALCTDGDVYYRVDPVTGLIEYKKVYHNSGWHDFGDFEYVDEDHCACTCKVCGYTETEEHYWMEEYVLTEPTHASEGVSRKSCAMCGANIDTVIPRTDEHVYDGTWTIVEPSV